MANGNYAPPPAHRSHATRSALQVLFLLAGVGAFGFLLASTKVLVIPLLLSITLYFVLNPMVNAIERSGFSRTIGAIIASLVFYVPAAIVSYLCVSRIFKEKETLEAQIPQYITYAQERLRDLESMMVDRFNFLTDANISTWMLDQIRNASGKFLTQSPEILNTVAWALVLLPILTFFFLRDVATIRNSLLDLTPNQYFEKAYNVTHQIERKIGFFIVAKIVEATLVGLLTFASLLALNFPYPVLFSVIAGATNIIPYFGPIIGYAPIVLTPFFVPNYESLFYPALIVSIGVNVLDMVVIFPLLVSRVIDLHPLVVLLSLVVGSSVAGPIGLLVAIPAAAIVKIFAYEVLSIRPRTYRSL